MEFYQNLACDCLFCSTQLIFPLIKTRHPRLHLVRIDTCDQLKAYISAAFTFDKNPQPHFQQSQCHPPLSPRSALKPMPLPAL